MENSEKQKENIKYPDIAAEIDKMVVIDQDMREKNLQDSAFWDNEIDRKNTERMKEIVAEIGWPTLSKVGFVASHNAWLLVQHADHDPAFQRECLDLMKQESEAEVQKSNVALLEDRVSLKEGGYQVYGTQYTQKDGKHVPLPIKDPENVDERRQAMGLDSLEENLARMYEKYGTPKKDE